MLYSLDELANSCRAYIIPTRCVTDNHALEILNQTYKAWEVTWKKVSQTTEYEFNADDFYRQDTVLSVLGPGGIVLGCHLYSFFDTKNLCNMSFSFYGDFHESVPRFVEQHKLRNLFSMEYLTVTNEFQACREVSLGRSIGYLSCRIFKNSHFDGMIART